MNSSFPAVQRAHHRFAAGALLLACLVLGPGSLAARADAATALAPAKFVKVGQFSAPVAVAQPPGFTRELWVVQKQGRIVIVRDGVKLETPALDFGGLIPVGDEQGLLGLAFPPDFGSSRLAYVAYTDRSNAIVVVEYRRVGDVLSPASKRVVMAIPKPYPTHNGGTIHFGPDGFLYLGTGDGGTGPVGNGVDPFGNAQNRGSLLGKILRIDPTGSDDGDYSVPPGNPFVGISDARPEVWAYGLRNPWKWSFGPGDSLWVGDVGNGTHEEIDRLTASGANLGWPIFEGPRLRAGMVVGPGLTAPIHSYRHSPKAGCAVIGGVVATDPALPTKLRGKYIFGDFCVGQLTGISVSGSRVTVAPTGLTVPGGGGLVSIDSGLGGRVYLSTLSGAVWRLAKR